MMSEIKKRAALLSITASASLAAMKFVVGLLTGSLGILSEAFHSLLDLFASSITFFAVRISSEPADERHNYGYGKIESVSALIESGFLFCLALWIIRESVIRLMGENNHLEMHWYAIAVIMVSIAVDFARSMSLRKIAKETGSHALAANALHFTIDMMSSCVVLIGLGFAAFGYDQADSFAAIGVSGFIMFAAWELGKETIDVLTDVAPEGIVEQVTGILAATPEVVKVLSVRARPAGNSIYVDALVGVNRTLTQGQVHELRLSLQRDLHDLIPKIELLLVAEPVTLNRETLMDTVRITAKEDGHEVHDIGVVEIGGRSHVAFDMEVEESLTILEAHDIATSLESRLIEKLGSDISFDIHIDPRSSRIVEGRLVSADQKDQVEAIVASEISKVKLVKEIHGLFVQSGEDGLYVAFHLVFPNDASLKEVHAISAQLEHRLMNSISSVTRVVIHTEPEDHVDILPDYRESNAFCAIP